ncbi:MAG: zinc ribbon domain-containing protein [Parcubacteria group bacterium]|nr:zinc ribbon domain-containing protein [Parcubacteria group bacterium]
MSNCPKCKDPIEEGETFCGKCGEQLGKPAVSSSTPVGETPTSAAPNQPPKKKKTWLYLLLGCLGLSVIGGIIVIIMFFAGAFGFKSWQIKDYVQAVKPDFEQVKTDIAALDANLTYKSDAETEEEIEAEAEKWKKELANTTTARQNAETAKSEVESIKVPSDVSGLNENLKSCYSDLIPGLEKREKFEKYFIADQEIGDRLMRASSFSDDTTDINEIISEFQQFKFNLDQAIADFEVVEVPDELKSIHDGDIKNLKQVSSAIGDMVLALQRWDDVGFNSSYNRFISVLDEYDKRSKKQSKEILDPEFKKLNSVITDFNTKKDSLEDEISGLVAEYNIE